MMDDRLPTANDRIAMVATQMDEMADGKRERLDCPYCMGVTWRGGDFCCAMLLRAATALQDAHDQAMIAKFIDRVMDRYLTN